MSKVIRSYEKQILLNNAYESWIQAIKNARNIKNGLVTLQYKKLFIATLHNAVELFLKQIMLNNTDYRVAKVKPSKLDKNGEPLKSYYQSTDLNDYFKNLSPDNRKNYFSIEFAELIEIHKEILSIWLAAGATYKPELKLLQKLRNDETHFYIEPEEFLTDAEFICLHNFMLDFNKILESADLLYIGNMPVAEENLLCFSDAPINNSNFSFELAVKSSPKVKTISDIINNQRFDYFIPPYELAECFEKEFSKEGISFDEAFSYIKSMLEYDFIDFIEENGTIEDEFGRAQEGFLGYILISIL